MLATVEAELMGGWLYPLFRIPPMTQTQRLNSWPSNTEERYDALLSLSCLYQKFCLWERCIMRQ
jgi:hypothetical protein